MSEFCAFEEDFQAWRKCRAESLMDDFAELCRYREANAALKPSGPDEDRIVFFGTPSLKAGTLKSTFLASPISIAA